MWQRIMKQSDRLPSDTQEDCFSGMLNVDLTHLKCKTLAFMARDNRETILKLWELLLLNLVCISVSLCSETKKEKIQILADCCDLEVRQ